MSAISIRYDIRLVFLNPRVDRCIVDDRPPFSSVQYQSVSNMDFYTVQLQCL